MNRGNKHFSILPKGEIMSFLTDHEQNAISDNAHKLDFIVVFNNKLRCLIIHCRCYDSKLSTIVRASENETGLPFIFKLG